MLITQTITKKLLEKIVHETFSSLGVFSSSSLLDSLKFLGFHYATNAGISINIEDLKTPDTKKKFLSSTHEEIGEVSERWQFGKISDTERFQSIIDSWNVVTESLKNRIIDYYEDFDPANNLYIMAFSGARGNMSQVRQLVGMRGLMSDQEGNIIDLPIQRNFREGLSSIDYVISSYGARKGIVDTALKTADSGYLTRRLIYLAQDLIIREIDCKSDDGITILMSQNKNPQNILGRYILSTKQTKFPFIEEGEEKGRIFTNELFNEYKQKSLPLQVKMRSVLTCQSLSSLCQKCYGWDLSQKKVITLGEAVGIIAAQSIGEPGTQLTMRTFHTGGIFTGETMKQIVAPFSGKLNIPSSFNKSLFRTNHGVMVVKLQQEMTVQIVDWTGKSVPLFLSIGSYLYHSQSCFLRKGEKIAEYSTQSLLLGNPRLKPLSSRFSGEILKFENLHIRNQTRRNQILRVNIQEGVIWVGLGKMISVPKETKVRFFSCLDPQTPLGKLKIMSPIHGYIELQKNGILIWNKETKVHIYFDACLPSLTNGSFQLCPTVQNYQYIDSHTILAFVFLFPKQKGILHSIRKKESKLFDTFFFITDSDVWKMNSDQMNSYSFFEEKRQEILPSSSFEMLRDSKTIQDLPFNSNSHFNHSGFFLKKNGFQMIFQHSIPIFLNRQMILNYKVGDFIVEKKVLGTLLKYAQQTEDIVQGLPKIEELIEARKPKNSCLLASRPGIYLPSYSCWEIVKNKKIPFMKVQHEKNHVIRCISKTKRKNTESPSTCTLFSHSYLKKKELIHYKKEYYSSVQLPASFLPYYDPNPKPPLYKKPPVIWSFLREPDFGLDSNLNALHCRFLLKKENQRTFFLRNFKKKWKTISLSSPIYEKKDQFIFQFRKNQPFFLFEKLHSYLGYETPFNAKYLVEGGQFVDLGEPITEGTIDIHELLWIFFQYHSILDGIKNGTTRCLKKFQLLLVHSIQAIYQSQGVNISTKHIEIIVLQMTSKVRILHSGETPFLPGEYIQLSYLQQICQALTTQDSLSQLPTYEPRLLSATYSSMNKDSFLSSAGFQETRRVLTKAAIEGTCDWLRGLKECIMSGRLMPAGTSFLTYKNYLDKFYSFQKSL